MEPLFVFGIVLLVISVGGFIWRVFIVPYRSKGKSNPSPDSEITNLELYRLLSSEIRWVISLQTGILAGLLVAILWSI